MTNPNLQLRVSPELYAAVTADKAWKAALERLLACVYLTTPVEPVRRRGRPPERVPRDTVKVRLSPELVATLRATGRLSREVEAALLAHFNHPPRTAGETLAQATTKTAGSLLAKTG